MTPEEFERQIYNIKRISNDAKLEINMCTYFIDVLLKEYDFYKPNLGALKDVSNPTTSFEEFFSICTHMSLEKIHSTVIYTYKSMKTGTLTDHDPENYIYLILILTRYFILRMKQKVLEPIDIVMIIVLYLIYNNISLDMDNYEMFYGISKPTINSFIINHIPFYILYINFEDHNQELFYTRPFLLPDISQVDGISNLFGYLQENYDIKNSFQFPVLQLKHSFATIKDREDDYMKDNLNILYDNIVIIKDYGSVSFVSSNPNLLDFSEDIMEFIDNNQDLANEIISRINI